VATEYARGEVRGLPLNPLRAGYDAARLPPPVGKLGCRLAVLTLSPRSVGKAHRRDLFYDANRVKWSWSARTGRCNDGQLATRSEQAASISSPTWRTTREQRHGTHSAGSAARRIPTTLEHLIIELQ